MTTTLALVPCKFMAKLALRSMLFGNGSKNEHCSPIADEP